MQCLQRRGYLQETEAMAFLRKTMESDITADALEELRLRINRELEFADIEIRRMVFPVRGDHLVSYKCKSWGCLELDGTRYAGLVNMQNEDFVTELLAKKHSSSTPEFFKRLVEMIAGGTCGERGVV